MLKLKKNNSGAKGLIDSVVEHKYGDSEKQDGS